MRSSVVTHAAASAPEPDLVAFCEGIYPQLVGVLVFQGTERSAAEELAQEALARTWARWATVRTMAHPRAWTFRVAMNLRTSMFRRRSAERRAHERARSGAAPVDEGGDPADAVAVRAAVVRLPDRQRAAIVLRYFADLSVTETALAMGCRAGTVKSLTSKAMAGLRSQLGPELSEHEGIGHG